MTQHGTLGWAVVTSLVLHGGALTLARPHNSLLSPAAPSLQVALAAAQPTPVAQSAARPAMQPPARVHHAAPAPPRRIIAAHTPPAIPAAVQPATSAATVPDPAPVPAPADSPSAQTNAAQPHPAALGRQRAETEVRRLIAANFYYPWLARQRGWSGCVTIGLAIAPDGRFASVQLLRSSGHTVLDEAALESVRRVGAVPQASADLQGMPLDLIVPIEYRLMPGGQIQGQRGKVQERYFHTSLQNIYRYSGTALYLSPLPLVSIQSKMITIS